MAGRRAAAALAGLASLPLLVAGCRAGCGEEATREGRPEAAAADVEPCVPLAVARAVSPEAEPGPDALFVLTSLRFGTESDGLDLDCTTTPASCGDDFCRDGPEDGEGGVDNRLGPLGTKLSSMSGTDLSAEMARAIEKGHHPLLLRVVRPTGWVEGSAEAVELSFGLDADGDPSDLPSGEGRVRTDPDAPPGRPARLAPVAIHDGVLVAGPSADWMPFFWTRRQIAAVPVEVAYLRMTLAQAPSGDPPLRGRIGDGVLAGAMTPDALSGAVLDLDDRTARVLTHLGPVVRALVRGQADLDLVRAGPTSRRCEEGRSCRAGESCRGGRCVEPEERFDALSFAIRFSAVSAVAVQLSAGTERRDGGSPVAR